MTSLPAVAVPRPCPRIVFAGSSRAARHDGAAPKSIGRHDGDGAGRQDAGIDRRDLAQVLVGGECRRAWSAQARSGVRGRRRRRHRRGIRRSTAGAAATGSRRSRGGCRIPVAGRHPGRRADRRGSSTRSGAPGPPSPSARERGVPIPSWSARLPRAPGRSSSRWLRNSFLRTSFQPVMRGRVCSRIPGTSARARVRRPTGEAGLQAPDDLEPVGLGIVQSVPARRDLGLHHHRHEEVRAPASLDSFERVAATPTTVKTDR